MAPSQTLVSNSDSEDELERQLADLKREQEENERRMARERERLEEEARRRKEQREERKRAAEAEQRRKEKEEAERKKKEEEQRKAKEAADAKRRAEVEKARKGKGRAVPGKRKAVEPAQGPSGKKAKMMRVPDSEPPTREATPGSDPEWQPRHRAQEDEDEEEGIPQKGKGKGKEKTPRNRGNIDDKGEKVKMGGGNECGRCRRLGKSCKAQEGSSKYACEPCNTAKQKCVLPTDADIPDHEMRHRILKATQQNTRVMKAVLRELCAGREAAARQHQSMALMTGAVQTGVEDIAAELGEWFDRAVLSDRLVTKEEGERRRRERRQEEMQKEREEEEGREMEKEEEEKEDGGEVEKEKENEGEVEKEKEVEGGSG